MAGQNVSRYLSPVDTVSDARFDYVGVGVVSGVTKVDGVPSPCRVSLHSVDNVLCGTRLTGLDGAYSFLGLAHGEYYLTIADNRQSMRRAKVEHVVIVGPPAPAAGRVQWRVLFPAVPNGVQIIVASVEFIDGSDNQMTRSTLAQSRATGMDLYSPGSYPPWNAFDDDPLSVIMAYHFEDDPVDVAVGWWFDDVGGVDRDVRKVAIGLDASTGTAPDAFVIQSTLNGDDWVSELTITGQLPWPKNTRRVFTLP